MEQKIQIKVIQNQGLIDSEEGAKYLQKTHGIFITGIGFNTLQQSIKQNRKNLSQKQMPPFYLDKYSLAYLYEQKLVKILNFSQKIQENIQKTLSEKAYKLFKITKDKISKKHKLDQEQQTGDFQFLPWEIQQKEKQKQQKLQKNIENTEEIQQKIDQIENSKTNQEFYISKKNQKVLEKQFELKKQLYLQQQQQQQQQENIQESQQKNQQKSDFKSLDEEYKGHYLTLGGKFGGKFLVYDDHPQKIHSKALIFTDKSIPFLEMQRAANLAKKTAVVQYLNPQQPEKEAYISINRFQPKKDKK